MRMTWLLLTELSMKMMTQSPDIHVLDVIPKDGLEVSDEDDVAHVDGLSVDNQV